MTVHEAKTNLSRLLQMGAAGEEVIIARGSEPVAKLVALKTSNGARIPGSMKGQLKVGSEFLNRSLQTNWPLGNKCTFYSIRTPYCGGLPMTNP